MRHFLGAVTDRGYSMTGIGLGLGLAGYILPVPGFTPKKVSGLLAWYDAANVGSVYQSAGGSLATADGDPVGQWQDLSGNGYHWAQASGTNKPAFRTNVKNGRPVIRFDGVNDYMSISGSASAMKALHTGNSSVFVVFNCSSLAATRFLYDSTNASGSNTGSYLRVNTTGAFQRFVAAGAANAPVENVSASSAVVAGSWYVTAVVTMPADATAANRDRIYKNGGTAIANNTQTQAPSGSNSTADYVLGGSSPSGSFPFVGDIAELIWYSGASGAVSDADRNQLVSYLNAKYGIY